MARSPNISNSASALGEAVGKLFEEAVRECVREEVETRGYTIQADRLTNGTGNRYQIDAVIYDADKNPIIIIDPKYIRYTKHNRDKVSWLCVAHYNLRKTYTTIRKSIAVLAGRWSEPSKALARSFGVETLEVPFDRMVEVLSRHGLAFDWPEKNRTIPSESLRLFGSLDKEIHSAIGTELIASIENELRAAVNNVLDADIENLPARVSGVEMLLKTDRDELILRTFDSVLDSMRYITELLSDRQDVTEFLISESIRDEPKI